MKHFNPITLSILLFTACQTHTAPILDDSNFPFASTAQKIEHPEDCIPVRIEYQDEKPMYIVGDKPAESKDLEDSIVAYLEEDDALAFRLYYDKEWDEVLNLCLQADSTVFYADIFALKTYVLNLSFNHIIFETKSLDHHHPYGIKRGFRIPYDETYDYITSKYSIEVKKDTIPYFFYSFSTKIQDVLQRADTSTVDDIIIEMPRQSEPPPPPPPPPTDIQSIFKENIYGDDYVERLNPIFINLTKQGINHLDGETITNEEAFKEKFERLLWEIAYGDRRRTTAYNNDRNKLADVFIMLSVEDDVPYYQWLNIRSYLTDFIENDGLDALIEGSCPFEQKMIRAAIRSSN